MFCLYHVGFCCELSETALSQICGLTSAGKESFGRFIFRLSLRRKAFVYIVGKDSVVKINFAGIIHFIELPKEKYKKSSQNDFMIICSCFLPKSNPVFH